MITASEIAKVCGGTSSGNTASIPGPGHSRLDRSLAVTVSQSNPDGFVVHSYAGDDPLACRDHVRSMLGLAPFSPGRSEDSSRSMRKPTATSRPAPSAPVDDQGRIKSALRLWGEGVSPVGTLAEAYLETRALTLPESVVLADALRFHPACPYRDEIGEMRRHPTMLALMRCVRTGEPTAVHRTALRRDGRGKAAGLNSPKMMLGRAKGSAVMLTAFEDVASGLNISEGIENGLTGLCHWNASPMWALGSAGAIADFPALSGVEFLTIWADPGKVGIEAAERCAATWLAAGAEGQIKYPVGQSDWNDVVRSGKAAA